MRSASRVTRISRRALATCTLRPYQYTCTRRHTRTRIDSGHLPPPAYATTMPHYISGLLYARAQQQRWRLSCIEALKRFHHGHALAMQHNPPSRCASSRPPAVHTCIPSRGLRAFTHQHHTIIRGHSHRRPAAFAAQDVRVRPSLPVARPRSSRRSHPRARVCVKLTLNAFRVTLCPYCLSCPSGGGLAARRHYPHKQNISQERSRALACRPPVRSSGAIITPAATAPRRQRISCRIASACTCFAKLRPLAGKSTEVAKGPEYWPGVQQSHSLSAQGVRLSRLTFHDVCTHLLKRRCLDVNIRNGCPDVSRYHSGEAMPHRVI